VTLESKRARTRTTNTKRVERLERLERLERSFLILRWPRLGLHNSKLCTFSVRDTRPCLSGNLFCGHFSILDGLFDSIWSDTTANQAIDNIFSSQRPGRFPYLSYVSQHIFWNICHSAPLSGFHPRCKSDGVLGSIRVKFSQTRARHTSTKPLEPLEPSCSDYCLLPNAYCLFGRSLRSEVRIDLWKTLKDQRSAIKTCDINEHEQARSSTPPAPVSLAHRRSPRAVSSPAQGGQE
jgi:hypothetical protein